MSPPRYGLGKGVRIHSAGADILASTRHRLLAKFLIPHLIDRVTAHTFSACVIYFVVQSDCEQCRKHRTTDSNGRAKNYSPNVVYGVPVENSE